VFAGLLAPALWQPSPASAGGPHNADLPTLADETGLTVSIESIDPSILRSGDRLRLSGSVQNDSDHSWSDAKVYLEMSELPADTKSELDAFALTGDEKFGDRIVALGYFDEIGAIKAGQGSAYHLSIPYEQLRASGALGGGAGVYHIAVAVLASEAGFRDTNADARTDALLPVEDSDTPPTQETSVTTLIPITAPVPRQSADVFAGDRLAAALGFGGRLRNLLDFVMAAPPDSVDLVVDPALLDALRAMADGYQVIDLADGPDAEPQPGQGQQDAVQWLDDFHTAAVTQTVDFLPWANADTSGLAAAGLPGVAEAAYRATRQFASQSDWPTAPIVDWQSNSESTRRGLVVAWRGGARVHVVSQDALTQLQNDANGYPPPLATVDTHSAPLTVTVSRSDLAGAPFDASTTALEFRQRLLADAMVRAISSTPNPSTVIAAPFRWNPGFVLEPNVDLTSAYDSSLVSPRRLGELTIDSPSAPQPVFYQGPIDITARQPLMSTGLESAIKRLRNAGRVYTALLTDGHDAALGFDQQLGEAASAAWLWQQKRGETLIRRSALTMSNQIRKVTVTGPEFVALSSEAGRFPLTVSNGLDVSVTVNVSVVPRNPALSIDPIEPIVLGPGQQRVVEVQSRAAGSGVTSVRARLATSAERPFGRAWDFDIRATRIGVAIWILLGVLIAALFGGAALRIARRIRGGGFRTRGQRPA
jgi:hypothetical protein